MHEEHWKAAEQHELGGAVPPHCRGTQRERGFHSGSLAFRTSDGVLGSRVQTREGNPKQIRGDREPLKCPHATTTDHITRTINEPRSCTICAAHAHRSAAEAHEKQDHQTGQELSRRALEHSQQAYEHTATGASKRCE